MNNYDYPEGADNPQAPWNQNSENEQIQINVTVSETLSRTIPINVSNYNVENRNEDGMITQVNVDKTELRNEYYHQYHSIENILSGIYGFLVYLNNKYHFKPSDLETAQRIIEACKGWNEDESEVVYE